MAKLQRGEAQSESEKVFSAEMSGSSEDEGPEEVAFDESKTRALKSVKNALQSARRDKALLKEKRKKRQEFFQEQKKKRLLPESLLEEFDTVPQKQPDETSDEKDETEEGKVKVKESKKVFKSLQGNCRVMRLRDESADITMQRSAMNFIHARLYGPGTQRTTNAQILSLEKKRGINKGAAVQFVNKKWGTDQKAKAAKSNKRFIHKQKLVPS